MKFNNLNLKGFLLITIFIFSFFISIANSISVNVNGKFEIKKTFREKVSKASKRKNFDEIVENYRRFESKSLIGKSALKGFIIDLDEEINLNTDKRPILQDMLTKVKIALEKEELKSSKLKATSKIEKKVVSKEKASQTNSVNEKNRTLVPQGFVGVIEDEDILKYMVDKWHLGTSGLATCVGIVIKTQFKTILIHADDADDVFIINKKYSQDEKEKLIQVFGKMLDRLNIPSASVIFAKLFLVGGTSKIYANVIKEILFDDFKINADLVENNSYTVAVEVVKGLIIQPYIENSNIAENKSQLSIKEFLNVPEFVKLFRFDINFKPVNTDKVLSKIDAHYIDYK